MTQPHATPNHSMLDYPWPEAIPPASVKHLHGPIHWVRMPLPFKLNHINLWLLEGESSWAMVDTGIGNTETKAHWEQIFAIHLGGKPVRQIVATHFHPDHMGNAGWLVKHWQAQFYATLTEWSFGRMLSLIPPDGANEVIERFYRRLGVASATLGQMHIFGNNYARVVTPLPEQLVRLRDGDRVTLADSDWEVIITRGHSPEHACLWNAAANSLIVGDQVLPAISPNVSIFSNEPEAEPLSDFLTSLDHLRQRIPADALVLPSHGLPYRGLHQRIDALKQHHAERLEELLGFCETPTTIADLTPRLFPRELDTHQMVFALGEAAAHINHLLKKGQVKLSWRDDGAALYQRC